MPANIFEAHSTCSRFSSLGVFGVGWNKSNKSPCVRPSGSPPDRFKQMNIIHLVIKCALLSPEPGDHTLNAGCHLQDHCYAREGNGQEHVTMPQNSPYSAFVGCQECLTIFQSSNKLDSNSFSVFSVFVERIDLQSPLLLHFHQHHSVL
uniref:Uncharacterized protein n=1 Tax=Pipistrellus kuhlii TaxID=59472 RepID=A0A7J8A8E2_PIPKU|nr:hypothetical protein mPipKuh1_008816 [Pipistrellus kuhlii]